METQVALVTGGSRGIGRAVALALAAEGARVAINYRVNTAAAQAVQAEIENRGGQAFIYKADVARPEQACGLVEEVLSRYSRLDVLVNNAGISRDGLVAQMKPDLWREVMEVNFGGTFNCTQAALQAMMLERRGAIVNISSVMGERAWQGQANYAASKAAINALTRCTALEMARFGIRVNALASGFVPTDLVAPLLEKHEAGILRQIPLRDFATVEDVARAVVFLASEDARYITGEILHLDGGVHMALAMGTPNPR